ncbi:MAG: hypothetical protein ACAH80_09025 [Alphaproteobacteria bacterium]
MNLIEKFNVSYKQSKGVDVALEMIQTSTYGSNSFCYDRYAHLQANDSTAPAATAPAAKTRNW